MKTLEEECKQKETERVNLELELTEVKESLRKALAGGITLGLAIEPRSGTSSPQVTSASAPKRLRGCGRPGKCPPDFLKEPLAVPQPQHGRYTMRITFRHFLHCVLVH